MALQLNLGCFGDNRHRACKCCKITATKLNACETRVEWSIVGDSPTLKIGNASPVPVAESGSQVYNSAGPFVLSATQGSDVITCTAAAVPSCNCTFDYIGRRAAGYRRTVRTNQLNPLQQTCTANWFAGSNNGSSTWMLSVTGTPQTLLLDYAINESCQILMPPPFSIDLGTFMETHTLNGSVRVGGVTTAFSGTRVTTFNIEVGWNGTNWYWRHYGASTTITGNDASALHSGGFYVTNSGCILGTGNGMFGFIFAATGFSPFGLIPPSTEFTTDSNRPPVTNMFWGCIPC